MTPDQEKIMQEQNQRQPIPHRASDPLAAQPADDTARAHAEVLAYDAKQLAERLGVSLRHVRRMDRAGHLPAPVRLGASVRWPVREVEAWLLAGAPERRNWNAIRKEYLH